MIIWLASFPRSGNSFFRIVSKNVFGREIYSIYNEARAPLKPDELQRMSEDNNLHLVKTHEMPSDQNKAIYLVRDGRDSLVSLTWFNLTSREAPQRDIPKDQFNTALKEAIMSNVYGGWSENILAWLNRPDPIVVVRFEDLIAQPEETVSKSFEAFGLNKNDEQRNNLPSFEKMHERNPFLFRKGKVGGWKEEMPDDLHNLFWEIHGKGMDALGYIR